MSYLDGPNRLSPMSNPVQLRRDAVVSFLRNSASSFSASAPGQTPVERAAAIEVENEISSLLELYRQGGLPESPSVMLGRFTNPPAPVAAAEESETVAIR